MQAVASYISRRFFVGNCRKFVVSLSDCQRKTFIFKACGDFLVHAVHIIVDGRAYTIDQFVKLY